MADRSAKTNLKSFNGVPEHNKPFLPVLGVDDAGKIHDKMNADFSYSVVKQNKGPPKWRSQRYILAYFTFTGMMCVFLQRINLSIAIVCMVNHTAISHNSHNSLMLHKNGNIQSSFSISQNTISLFNRSESHSEFESKVNDHGGNIIASPSHDERISLKLDDVQVDPSVLGYKSGYTLKKNNISLIEAPYGLSLSEKHIKNSRRTSDELHEGDWNPEEEKEKIGKCSMAEINSLEKEDGPFAWSKQEQGLLLGALYWTYATTGIPGNHLVRNIPRKKVIVVSMATMAAMTMLIHPAALLSVWAVFVLKLVQGASTAVVVIALYGMWMKWAPPRERTELVSFVTTGQMFANIIVFPLSALLCKYGFLGGWPSVFYVFGIVAILWTAIFAFFIDESPDSSRFITDEEMKYIVNSIAEVNGDSKPPASIPWLSIMTSPALWATLCGHVSFSWGYFLLLSTLPQYMLEVLKLSIQSNGFYSMLPYMAILVTNYLSGYASDWCIKRNILSVQWTRRMCTLVGNVIPAVCLTAMSFLDCTQPGLAITLLVVAVGATGFSLAGFLVVPYDVAPRFAPIFLTITCSVSSVCGIVAPFVVAAITQDQTPQQWQIVFFLTGGILLAGAFGFCVLVRGTIQEWAISQDDDSPEDTDWKNNVVLKGSRLDMEFIVEEEKTSLKDEHNNQNKFNEKDTLEVSLSTFSV